jgi:tripartite-type tricarboxylate transporter receptor subunit TctC
MRTLLIASFLAAASVGIGAADAQTYPSRPITMVVPLPTGSAFDLTARILAERMQASLHQPVIVENVTGASGSVGAGRVARASADGYTLCFGGVGTHVLNGAILPLTYDVLRDFAPVALVARAQLMIVAKKDMEAKSLAELVAWLRANPGKAVRGTGGAGSLTNIAGLSFAQRTGTHFRSVPYRGASAAANDLLAGHIDFMIDLAPNSLAHVRAGAIKGYAVLSATRMAAAPDLPTVDDAGLPGFHMSAWQAVWAPKNTPPAVLHLLNTAIVEALADSTVQARLAELGQETFPSDQQSAAALGAWQKAEIDRWWPIIKAAGIQGDER